MARRATRWGKLRGFFHDAFDLHQPRGHDFAVELLPGSDPDNVKRFSFRLLSLRLQLCVTNAGHIWMSRGANRSMESVIQSKSICHARRI